MPRLKNFALLNFSPCTTGKASISDTGKLLLSALLLLLPLDGYGFGESICHNEQSGWFNCVGRSVPARCTSTLELLNNPSPSCRDAALRDVDTIKADTKTARMEEAHYIFPYIIAQGLGMRAEAAYWLAIFGSVPDLGATLPVDKFGEIMRHCPQLGTPAFNALNRNSRKSNLSGGMLYHFPFRFHSMTNTGAFPNFFDPFEGPSVQLLQYAMGLRSNACIGGVTHDTNTYLISSMGYSCYHNELRDWLNSPTDVAPKKYISYDEGVVSYSGDAIVEYTPDSFGSTTVPADVVFLDEAQSVLDASPGRYQGDAVPAELFNLALALHTQIDRISHAECIDNSPMLIDRKGRLIPEGNDKNCGGNWHAWNHYIEWGSGVHNPKVESAIGTMYDGIFIFLLLHPEYRDFTKIMLSRQELQIQLSLIAYMQTAKDRVESYNQLISGYGMTALPGHGLRYQPGQCPTFN